MFHLASSAIAPTPGRRCTPIRSNHDLIRTCRQLMGFGVVWRPDGATVSFFHLPEGSWLRWRRNERPGNLSSPSLPWGRTAVGGCEDVQSRVEVACFGLRGNHLGISWDLTGFVGCASPLDDGNSVHPACGTLTRDILGSFFHTPSSFFFSPTPVLFFFSFFLFFFPRFGFIVP